VEAGDDQNNPGPDGAPPDRAAGERDDAQSARDQTEAGSKIPAQVHKAGSKRFTKTEIAIALRESDGNIELAARALGCAQQTVRWWIKDDVELNALWGGMTPRSPPVEAPNEAELMDRSPETQPSAIPSPAAVNLALGIAEQDAKILLEGLKALGIQEKTLDRLRKLDGLAQSNGHFLSVSLQTTHRMYFLQLVEMMEVAQKMKSDYLDYEQDDPKNPGQKLGRLTHEERAWFYKCYTEMVKEAGKGYNTMMEGTKAMVMMLKAAAGDGDKPKTGKPKWHERQAAKTAKKKS
jgi:hypothetical protein